MDITPLVPAGKNNITGYGDNKFKVNDTYYEGNIMILPDSVNKWPCTNAADITIESLLEFTKSNKIEILIIGCGHEHIAPPAEITSHFRTTGIKIEFMATGPACRTYNVLLTEGRDVGAALIAV